MGYIFGTLHAESGDWQEVLLQIDTNGDGQIDYEEFIAASANRNKLLTE